MKMLGYWQQTLLFVCFCMFWWLQTADGGALVTVIVVGRYPAPWFLVSCMETLFVEVVFLTFDIVCIQLEGLCILCCRPPVHAQPALATNTVPWCLHGSTIIAALLLWFDCLHWHSGASSYHVFNFVACLAHLHMLCNLFWCEFAQCCAKGNFLWKDTVNPPTAWLPPPLHGWSFS